MRVCWNLGPPAFIIRFVIPSGPGLLSGGDFFTCLRMSSCVGVSGSLCMPRGRARVSRCASSLSTLYASCSLYGEVG